MTTLKNAAVSARIAVEISKGKTLPEAMDAVLGAGSFARIASDAYDGLRAKAGV